MKTRSTPEEISRRQFAKLVSGAVLVTSPLAISVTAEQAKKSARKPARPQAKSSQIRILTHIPPIDMMNGSFTVSSGEPLDDDVPNDHAMGSQRPIKHQSLYNEVKWVRILAANGDMLFNSYETEDAAKAQIEIWFAGNTTDKAHILIRKEDNSPHITFEARQKLVAVTGGSGELKYRRKYQDSNVQVKHVRITKPGSQPKVVSSEENKTQIEHIKVWTYD